MKYGKILMSALALALVVSLIFNGVQVHSHKRDHDNRIFVAAAQTGDLLLEFQTSNDQTTFKQAAAAYHVLVFLLSAEEMDYYSHLSYMEFMMHKESLNSGEIAHLINIIDLIKDDHIGNRSNIFHQLQVMINEIEGRK